MSSPNLPDIPTEYSAPAPCPYFGACGGCSLQHATQEFYRSWKIDSLKDLMARNGLMPEKYEEPVFLPAATRRRTSTAAVKASGRVIFGYNEARSHKILNIEKCLVLDPALDTKAQAIRPYLTRLLPDNKTCDFTLQHVGAAFDLLLTGPFKFGYAENEAIAEMANALDIARVSWRAKDLSPIEVLLTRKSVVKRFGNIAVELPPSAFLQASDAGEKAISGIVLRHAAGAKNIADLFCGCGTFAGQLPATTSVTAIDSAADAISALQRAAKGTNIKAERRNLFKSPLGTRELSGFDCVIFDPPRAGAKEQAETLAHSGVAKIIAVSCNPATFARDAKILTKEGYRLSSLTLVDQFVFSTHSEVVGLFVL